MPINKRESLLFTFIMCFCMVLWMSIYNVALQHGAINGEVIAAAWLGFPVAYIFAATGLLPAPLPRVSLLNSWSRRGCSLYLSPCLPHGNRL